MPDLARYIGPIGASAGIDDPENGPQLVPLIPHETIVPVSRSEAEASENWEPVDEQEPVQSDAAPALAGTKPSESAGTGDQAGSPSEQRVRKAS